MPLFSTEIEHFVRGELQGVENSIGVELINKRFSTNFKVSQLRAWRKNNKCPSGYDAKFQKGHDSEQKGKTWEELGFSKESLENMRATCFKKGNRPHNVVPLGTEKVHEDGYIFVKVADGKGNSNWIQKHRFVWEQANGPIPKGMYIFFKDGDRSNCNLENLALVGGEAKVIAKEMQNNGTDELWDALAMLGRLNNKIGEIKDGRQDKE